MRRFLVVAIVGILAACGSSGGGGGDSSSAEGQKYVDAAMKNYDKAPAQTKKAISESQARCLARGVVDAVGVDGLKSEGITPSDFESGSSPFSALKGKITKEQARAIAALAADGTCLDLLDIVVKEARSATALAKLTTPQLRCVYGKVLAKAGVKESLANSILGSSSAGSGDDFGRITSDTAAMTRIFDQCNVRLSQLTP